MKLNIVTDMDIQALVDDELKSDKANRVLNYIKSNSNANQRHKELVRQKILLKKWWRQSQN